VSKIKGVSAMKWEQYRKLIAATATAIIEIVAVWADAPSWLLSLVPLLGAVAVWAVKNEPQAGSQSGK